MWWHISIQAQSLSSDVIRTASIEEKHHKEDLVWKVLDGGEQGLVNPSLRGQVRVLELQECHGSFQFSRVDTSVADEFGQSFCTFMYAESKRGNV